VFWDHETKIPGHASTGTVSRRTNVPDVWVRVHLVQKLVYAHTHTQETEFSTPATEVINKIFKKMISTGNPDGMLKSMRKQAVCGGN